MRSTFAEAVYELWATSGSLGENAKKIQRKTGFDKYKLLQPDEYLTHDEQCRFAIVWQTPKSVWADYLAAGYTLSSAIESEVGYA